MSKTERAERARAILEDALFIEAVQSIRKRHLTAFENSAPEAREAREQAYHMVSAINQLTGELQSAITDVQMQKGRHRAND